MATSTVLLVAALGLVPFAVSQLFTFAFYALPDTRTPALINIPVVALRVLLQVNVDDDPAKSGFEPADLGRDLPAIVALPALAVEGLMTVGRLVEDAEAARPTFVALRQLSERLRLQHPGLGPELSMGMTDDYPVAVEEGATIVRIGRAIFGDRPHDR